MSTPTRAPVAATGAGRSGTVDIDIGTRPYGFGSQGQASELLALIDREPNKSSYSVTYRTTDDVVVFGCDLGTGALVRVHRRPNGRGSSERWTGHVVERLRSAAAGGSLNDTPAGKSFAVTQDF